MDRETLLQAIAAQERLRGVLPDDVVDATVVILRQQLAMLGEERRRYVTILFADVSGFTSMSEAMDAEHLTEVMHGLWQQLDAVIIRHGGRVDKHIGDAVMAVWGADTSREDDVERAVRAGLAVQEALGSFVASTGHRLAMRVGINTGPVVLSTLGSTRELDVMGDAVNVASRLEGAAPIGQVLVSAETLRHVDTVFDVRPIGPLALKGKSSRTEAFVVVGVKDRRFRPPAAGLVGRDDEVDALVRAVVRFTSSHTAVAVSVIGEAGIGKSRLIGELIDHVANRSEPVTVLVGHATRAGRDARMGVLRDAIARAVDVRETDPPEIVADKLAAAFSATLTADEAEQVGHFVGFDLSTRPSIRRLVGGEGFADVALDLFAAHLRAIAPVVIIAEDVHWADTATVVALDALLDRLADAAILVVVTARPDELDLGGPEVAAFARSCDQLTLAALSHDVVRTLVGRMLHGLADTDRDIIEMVAGRADGSPLFAEELVQVLIERRVIDPSNSPWKVDRVALDLRTVPATLVGALQARLDALTGPEQTVLRDAAVIGRVFWDEALVALRGDAVDDVTAFAVPLASIECRDLVHRRLTSTFADTSELAFKHVLVRDVAYESVLLRDRPRLHERAAAWLEQQIGDRAAELAPLIADHLLHAGRDGEAAGWYRQAARYASSAYANEDALRWLRAADDLTAQSDAATVIETLLQMNTALDRLGRRDEQREVLERAAEVADELGDPLHIFDVTIARSALASIVGDFGGALLLATDAFANAKVDGTIDRRARAALAVGKAQLFSARYAEAQSTLNEAAQLAEVANVTDVHAEALRSLAMVARDQGDPSAAIAFCEEGVAALQAAPDLAMEGRLRFQVASIRVATGELDAALRDFRQARVIFERTGDRYYLGATLQAEAFTTGLQGRVRSGDDGIARANEILAQVGDAAGVAYGNVHRGQIAILAGAFQRAVELIGEALIELERHDEVLLLAHGRLYLVEALIGVGRLADARHHLDLIAVDAAQFAIESNHALVAGYLALAEDDADAAHDAFTRARDACETVDDALGVCEATAGIILAEILGGDVPTAAARATSLTPHLSFDELTSFWVPCAVLVAVCEALVGTGDRLAATAQQAALTYVTTIRDRLGDLDLVTSFDNSPWTRRLQAQLP
jgi:class 3 adenylate cyclase/tetratricopeptide (TPR) repeat protein